MDPVGSFAGGLAFGSAGVETWSGTKKKMCIESIYVCGSSYKKVKKPDDSGVVVDLSAGLLAVDITSDIKNMKNTIMEKMSYINFNTSGDNELMNNATPKNLRMRTYIFEHLPKQPSFINMGGADDILELPSYTFNESIQLLPVTSRDREIQSFISVKFFALDIELSVVPGKTVSDKLICVKKFFYQMNGFGGASTPSKFLGIIRSSFTSEMSLNKVKELAISKNILVNDDLRRIVIVEEISVDLPKLVIKAVFSKFAIIEFELAEVVCLVASKWSVLVEKNSMWVLKDHHQALLYTLLIGMTAHDLADLLESYGGKTCFIGRNPGSYVHNRCTIICFENETAKLAAFGLVPVFKGVSLCWAGLSLACCTACKQYDYISGECSVGENFGGCGKKVVTDLNCVHLASIYKKKQAPVTHPVSFSGKTWTSVVGAPLVCSLHDAGLLFGSNKVGKPLPPVASNLEKHLVNIESSLISLVGQIGELAKRLELLILAVSQPSPRCVSSGESTSDETTTVSATIKDSPVSPHVIKLENMLEGFAALMLSLFAHFDGLVLAGGACLQHPSQ
ncbi:hypothetical protein G9A89_016046 [Geosiphon pyriformis]|nr:hypothetical protein G9A89_016046 [Geosiphon pyriformis]